MDTSQILKKAREDMQKAVEHTRHELGTLNTGKAQPSMVENIMVDVYGTMMRIKDIAAITTPDARLIQIQPWDKGSLKPIEKAIQTDKLGVNPVIHGDVVRCPLPELSRERRAEMAKAAGTMGEEGKVRIRAVRREAIDALKKSQKDSVITEDDLKKGEKDIQAEHDKFIADIGKLIAEKEQDLMKV